MPRFCVYQSELHVKYSVACTTTRYCCTSKVVMEMRRLATNENAWTYLNTSIQESTRSITSSRAVQLHLLVALCELVRCWSVLENLERMVSGGGQRVEWSGAIMQLTLPICTSRLSAFVSSITTPRWWLGACVTVVCDFTAYTPDVTPTPIHLYILYTLRLWK